MIKLLSYAVLTCLAAGRCCCQDLANISSCSFPDQTALPGTPTYEVEQNGTLRGYWSAQESEIQPACRCTPKSSRDAPLIVALLIRHECQFAIRGGGHMWWAGAANLLGGVTIDMGGLNEVTVSDDHTVAHIGAGARWEDVYEALQPKGLATAGGRVLRVGVSGLILGGGISYFSPRFGWVCDTLVNVEMVLPSGHTVNVNRTSYSNIFRALKGGSLNYGLVTRFDLQAFPQGEMWGGIAAYPYENTTKHLENYAYYTAQQGSGVDNFASMEMSLTFNASGGLGIGYIMAYTKPEPFPEILRNFTNGTGQVANTLRSASLVNLATEGGAWVPNATRSLFATATFANNATLLAGVLQLAEDTFRNASMGSSSVYLVLEPISRAITRHAHRAGGNVLGLDDAPDLHVMDLSTFWPADAKQRDGPIEAVVDLFLQRADAYTRAESQHIDFLYLNYATNKQDPLRSYGKPRYDFLRQVALRNDPMRVWHNGIQGGYKLDLS